MTARTTIHVGDALAVLQTLPSESVQCIVTSPPYYGLRDYGTATWEGGDEGCDHKERNARNDPDRDKRHTDGRNPDTQNLVGVQDAIQYRDTCGKCGATRIDDQLGLEPTPDEYVARLVAVFREARRVLRDDGVLWLNLGDSYAGGGGFSANAPSTPFSKSGKYGTTGALMRSPGDVDGLKPKDLIGIPWRVAFALQADGWWLRSDCIWHKPNPMPESVTDRPTKAHEYVFLLSKSARYFYDADAVAEEGAEPRAFWEHTRGDGRQAMITGRASRQALGPSGFGATGTRNRRTVWTITPQPYSGAHFATMPPDLVEVCVKAGTSERGCCPECGAAWERVVEKTGGLWETRKANGEPMRMGLDGHGAIAGITPRLGQSHTTTIGWQPTCDHDAAPVPCAVLDPFGGAGTTGLVANRLDRDAVLIELNADYAEMARERIYGDAPMFANVEVV